MTTPPLVGAGRSPAPTRRVLGPAAERMRNRCGTPAAGNRSGAAGRVVRPVGQELLPFLLREAPSGHLACSRLPVRRIDVPEPRRSRFRDDDDGAAVGGE